MGNEATISKSPPPPSKGSLGTTSLFDQEQKKADPKSSILDEILQPTKSVARQKTEPQEKPKSPPKSNADFLEDLFGAKSNGPISEPKKGESVEMADSGFENSLESTPKQAQSAKMEKSMEKMTSKTKSIDLDEDLFSPRKPAGPKAASNANGMFPWEMDAVKKSQPKANGKTDDLFSNVQNLGAISWKMRIIF